MLHQRGAAERLHSIKDVSSAPLSDLLTGRLSNEEPRRYVSQGRSVPTCLETIAEPGDADEDTDGRGREIH